jgi:sterol desaturase/sphingolipid hydroxylase (fatty acid hydroxylase superfamily)
MRTRRLGISDSARELPGGLRGLVIVGVMTILVALERRRSLRKPARESKLYRDLRNFIIAGGAGLVMRYVERPLALSFAKEVQRRGWGLVPRLARRRFAQTVLAVLLLDYSLYLWHVLTHKLPFLWRFHLVHHIDLDLDASTALRFHFGEMLVSVPWRLAQIAVIGVSPGALSLWQTLLFASILFHHSNVKLPVRAERLLSFVVMTPRLHGIHHEANFRRSNTNWSSGLTVWDLLHGTYHWDEWHGSKRRARIGVPAYQSVDDVTLESCLTIPFGPQREDWTPDPS